MQVSVEATGALGRRLIIELPYADFEKEEAKQLKKIQQKAKIDGFRPGKAPLDVIRRFSPDFSRNALFDLMQEKLWSAIEQYNKENPDESLRIASMPRFEPPNLEKDQPLKLSYLLEVYPTIELKLLNGVEITQISSEVQDSDVDSAIERLRKQFTTWADVEREAQIGDQLTFDFEGFVDNAPFEGNKAERFKLELGTKRMIPGFEEALVGMKVGEDRRIHVTFPADYNAESLAGKAAEFDIHVHQIQGPKLPEVNKQWIEQFGIADGELETFRKELKEGMVRELDITLRNQLKQEVFGKLLELNQIEVPAGLIQEEMNSMYENIKAEMRSKVDKSKLIPMFADEAKKRVMLGLLVSEIIKLHKIEPDAERVSALIEQRASAYENPEEMIKMYSNLDHVLEEMRALAIEEQVVAKLLDTAKVIAEPKAFMDVMQDQQR
ncbi:MAG: trigger factor [Gammaproteobacteria bacterium]|nr:trigger factor [Gammaproteobacteria bacterium]